MPQNKTETSLHPRPEAGALPKLDQLTSAQVTAARQVLGLLRGLGSHISTPEDDLNLPIRLDRLRHNGVLLIDGARGSGKTMLLVSLLAALRQIAFPRFNRAGRSDDPAATENAAHTLRTFVDKELGQQTLVVPLALIDLAPLPPSTNLLLHLVSCMEPMVEYLNAKSAAPNTRYAGPAWHADGGEQTPLRRDWCELARVIVGGWDQNPARRQAPSDMDSYAEEMMLAEQERQARRIADRIDKFLDGAAKQYQETHPHADGKPNILFLIAIDDADMSPKRVAELLESLRQLRSQRLTFLLTGDRVLFEHTLRHHCLSLITGPLYQHNVQSNREDLFAVWSRTSALALQMYDKLIPPHHHCTLHEIPSTQRLTHKFEIAEATGDLQPRSMKLLLDGIKVGGSELTLARIFEVHGQLNEALPGHLRPLINAALLGERMSWQREMHQDGSLAPQPATNFVEHLWQSALRDAGEQLDGLIGRCVTREQNLLSIDIVALALTSELQQDETESKLTTSVENHGKRLESRLLLGGLTRLNGVLKRERPLPRPVIAALQLAAVAAAEQAQAPIRSQPSNLTGFEPVLAAADIRHGEDLQLQVAWPLPAGCSFVDLAVLNWNWRLLTSQIKEPPANGVDPAEDYVRVYLDVINCYFTRLSTGAAMSPLMPERPLSDLIERTARSARTTMQLKMRQIGHFQKWALHQMGLLAAPESGLSPELANRILAKLRAEFSIDEWRSVRVGLARARAQRIEYSLKDSTYQGKLKEQLLAIEQTATQHAWRIEMENWEKLSEGKAPADEKESLGEYGIESYLKRVISGLGISISAFTMDGLGSASAAWALRWVNLLNDMPELPAKLYSIWQATMLRESYGSPEDRAGGYRNNRAEAETLVTLKNDGIQIPRAPWNTSPISETWSSVRHPLGPISELHLARVHPKLTPDVSLTRLQMAVLRVIWDLLQILNLASSEEPLTGSAIFDGAMVTLRYDQRTVEAPWPAPRWRTFFAVEQLFLHWNRELHRLLIIHEPPTGESEQDMFDCLAFYYLRLCEQGISGSLLAPEFPLKPPDAGRWAQVIEEIGFGPQNYNSGVTSQERVRFFQDILWLAAPESGLSAATADCILKAMSPRLPQRLPKEFTARRFERMQKLSKAQQKALLKSMAEEMPTHPFLAFWESRKPLAE